MQKCLGAWQPVGKNWCACCNVCNAIGDENAPINERIRFCPREVMSENGGRSTCCNERAGNEEQGTFHGILRFWNMSFESISKQCKYCMGLLYAAIKITAQGKVKRY